MKFNTAGFLLILTLSFLVSCGLKNTGEEVMEVRKPEPAAASVPVMRVTAVKLEIKESHPPILVIRAKGEVNTGGWTDIALTPHVYIRPPQDGIYGYDLRGVPPAGPAIQVITGVEATIEKSFSETPGVKGVKIVSKTNSLVKEL